MCHNIVDGRYHTQCSHFVPMSTRLVDCLRPNCLFSSRHAHPVGCRNSQCARLMETPLKNPIRVSPACCPNCIHIKIQKLGGPVGSAQPSKQLA